MHRVGKRREDARRVALRRESAEKQKTKHTIKHLSIIILVCGDIPHICMHIYVYCAATLWGPSPSLSLLVRVC